MWDDWRSGLFALLPARAFNLDLVWATLGLVGAILVGVVIIAWLDRWRKRSKADVEGPADDLHDYQALFDQGILNADEYERIRQRLEHRPQAAVDRQENTGIREGTPPSKSEAFTAESPAAPPGPPEHPPGG